MESTSDLKHRTEQEAEQPIKRSSSEVAIQRKSIYNIEMEYLQLMQMIEDQEGEITPEMNEALVINKAELEAKAVGYGYIIRQFDAEIAQISDEQARLGKLSAAKEKAKERLKTAISEAMQRHCVLKIQQNNLTLSFRKSENLFIDEGAHIPLEYIKTKEVETTDKAGLKAAIKEGKEFIGIWIQENQNLQIR